MEEELPETTNFVAEIPIYVQTKNPKGVEAVIRRLVRLLDIDIDLADLDRTSSEFEKNMSQAVAKHPELTKQIKSWRKITIRNFLIKRGILRGGLSNKELINYETIPCPTRRGRI